MQRVFVIALLLVATIAMADIDVENSDADVFLLSGNVYTRYTVFGQRGIIPDESFSIRRAGLTADVRLSDNLEAQIQIETRPTELYLKDCFLDWAPADWVGIRIGQFKKPFCLNTLTNSWDLMTMDHSLAHWTVLDLHYGGRDPGLEMTFSEPSGHVVFTAGIFNGAGFGEEKDNKENQYVARCVFALPYGIELGGGFTSLRLGEADPDVPSGYTSSPHQRCIGADVSFENEVLTDLDIRIAGEYVTGANWLLADVIEAEEAPDFESIWASCGGMLRLRNVPGIRSLEANVGFELLRPDDTGAEEQIISPVLGVWFSRTVRLRLGAQSHSFRQMFAMEGYTDYIVEAAVSF
jgi:hypothetical protein